jgi:hypothetical protein
MKLTSSFSLIIIAIAIAYNCNKDVNTLSYKNQELIECNNNHNLFNNLDYVLYDNIYGDYIFIDTLYNYKINISKSGHLCLMKKIESGTYKNQYEILTKDKIIRAGNYFSATTILNGYNYSCGEVLLNTTNNLKLYRICKCIL